MSHYSYKTLVAGFISASALLMTSCSGSDGETATIAEEPTNIPVQFLATASTSGPLTRAVTYSYFDNGAKFLVGLKSNTGNATEDAAINASLENGGVSTISVAGATGGSQTFTADPLRYWNDLGGRTAKIDVWGMFTPKEADLQKVQTGTATAWTVPADQSAGFADYDLLWSNNVKALPFKSVAELEFAHALSKVTIIVTIGEGFNKAADGDVTTLTGVNFKNLNTKGTFTASTLALADNGEPKNITAYKSADYDATTTHQVSYSALFVPGQTINQYDLLAELTIAGNVYKVKSMDAAPRTFESGKHYTYIVTVAKNELSFGTTVKIRDWDEVTGQGEAIINFSGAPQTGSYTGTDFKKDFDVYKSTDGSDYDSDNSAAGTQKATTAEWNDAQNKFVNNSQIYWQSDADANYFRGFSPVNTPVDADNNVNVESGDNDAVNDYIWGTSGDAKVNPTTDNVKMQFSHIMSKITVNVSTTDGADAVDLSTISLQEIQNIVTAAKFNIASNTFTLGAANASYTTHLTRETDKKYTYTFYAVPQTLTSAANFAIKVGTAPVVNQYNQQLTKVKKNATDYLLEWKAGQHYTYNILLRKAGQAFEAKIIGWEEIGSEQVEAEL